MNFSINIGSLLQFAQVRLNHDPKFTHININALVPRVLSNAVHILKIIDVHFKHKDLHG